MFMALNIALKLLATQEIEKLIVVVLVQIAYRKD